VGVDNSLTTSSLFGSIQMIETKENAENGLTKPFFTEIPFD